LTTKRSAQLVKFLLTLSVGMMWTEPVLLWSGERIGLEGIADLGFSRSGIPYAAPSTPDYQTNLNGQFILLGSFRITSSLYGFYEGRVSHQEGLDGSDPRIQETQGTPVAQGYIRFTPKLPWSLTLEAGKFGTPFGEFLTRNYPQDNPLIGTPLIYSYPTTIPARIVPNGPEFLLKYRYRPKTPQSYSLGTGGAWLPLINYAYPTGVMVYGSPRTFDYRFALVNSSIANPLDLGEPGQQIQWVGGGGWTIIPGFRVGTSLAEGPFLSGSVGPHLPPGTSLRDFTQRAIGFDLQYALHHFEAYAEGIFTNFKLPNISQRLGASGYYIELKYTWSPRVFTAVRWNQIFFDRLRQDASPSDNLPSPDNEASYVGVGFDQNINSLEFGLGIRITHKLMAKTSYQLNRTTGGADPKDNMFAAQLLYVFDVSNLLRIR